jgi:spore maturation protein CgeB
MGKRRTKRRSEILNQVARVLARHNFTMHIADNEIQPFVYGAERTKLLNRSKITLHLESNPFDNAFPYRYHIAAANGSLVVSEVLVPHYPLTPGEHYVSASPAELPRRVLHYLEKDQERQNIVANAHELVTTRLTFANSVKMIMAGIADVHC